MFTTLMLCRGSQGHILLKQLVWVRGSAELQEISMIISALTLLSKTECISIACAVRLTVQLPMFPKEYREQKVQQTVRAPFSTLPELNYGSINILSKTANQLIMLVLILMYRNTLIWLQLFVRERL